MGETVNTTAATLVLHQLLLWIQTLKQSGVRLHCLISQISHITIPRMKPVTEASCCGEKHLLNLMPPCRLVKVEGQINKCRTEKSHGPN